MKNTLLKLVTLPLLLAAACARGSEEGVAPAAPAAPIVPIASAADPADPVPTDSAVVDPVPAESAVPEQAVDDPVVADPVAAQDVDEVALSNAVFIAAAAARAAEEVRVAAAAQERAEADKAKLEAEEKAAREKAEAEAKAEAALSRRRISTRTFRLAHASAEDVAAKLNSTWSGDFGVTWKINKMAIAFPESNAVMITAPTLILDACEEVIRTIDIEPKQVYIEARFVELSNNVFHDIGIDWSMLDGMKGTVSLGGGIQKNRLGKGVQGYTRTGKDGNVSYSLSGSSLVGDADGDIAYFNGTLDFSQMYVILSALEGNQDARIFSNPKIIVSSGKKATVDMTTKYPNVKISAKRTSTSGSDSLDLDMQMAAIPGEDKFMFAKESFFSWGIELEVTPRIGTNGLINVQIVPTISSQSEWIDSGVQSSDTKNGTISAKYPVIEVQRLITEFSMASGTTAVIGGLSRTVEEQVDNGIPLLSDIPWIGPRLFGSSTRKKQQKEIIVFVTVGLVDPNEMHKDAGLPKNAILGRQYTKGQKLEPGDRPAKNLEGIGSLDLRSLEDQAKDPLPPPSSESSPWIPFTKDKKTGK
jgi:type II secretory pathway component GspD/PulD (secretin)